MKTTPAQQARLAAALADRPTVGSLTEVARTLQAEGLAQMPLYRLFDTARLAAEEAGDEALCELFDEVLDAIAGWCEPPHRLFATELEL